MIALDAPRLLSRDRRDGHGNPPTDASALFRSLAHQRFLEELAYYRADESYLPVEKRAERCHRLSQLLTAAACDTTITTR